MKDSIHLLEVRSLENIGCLTLYCICTKKEGNAPNNEYKYTAFVTTIEIGKQATTEQKTIQNFEKHWNTLNMFLCYNAQIGPFYLQWQT